ncbi:MAG: hypothetical protein ACYC7E_19265 [Armatimonadota bacterium]
MPFVWETIQTQFSNGEDAGVLVIRAMVPGGWFVHVAARVKTYSIDTGEVNSNLIQTNSFFYVDPEHVWDGGTIEQSLAQVVETADMVPVTPEELGLAPAASTGKGKKKG